MIDHDRKPRVGDVVIYHSDDSFWVEGRMDYPDGEYVPAIPLAAIVTGFSESELYLSVFVPNGKMYSMTSGKHGSGPGEWEYRDNEMAADTSADILLDTKSSSLSSILNKAARS